VLAGGAQHVQADPALAAIAHELVESIRRDLTVDWTDRGAAEAKIRTLLRRHRGELPSPPPQPSSPSGSPDLLNYFADLILDQAKALYRYWPETGERLFTEIS
jgi:type I restriction enzyme R subunit